MKKFLCLIICVLILFCCSNFKVNKCFATNENVSYKAMATMECSSGRLLYSYNEKQKLPMASTTKIITAICVIENNTDLSKIVEIPKEAQGIEGSSIYLRTGEHLSIKELLLGLMLQSGNDAAVALAIETSGSVEEFIKLENEFCERIGANNTHLVTPNGLHNKEHYTTASDLAKITAYALKNETFREIVGTQRATISNETEKEPRYLKNKNKLLFKLEGCTGVKTGYTSEAGRCLVASCKKNGMEVVCVVLNCKPMFEECERLLNLAFEEFEMTELLPEYNHYGKLDVETKEEIKKINVASKEGFCYPLSKTDKKQIKTNVYLAEKLKAPVKKEQNIGQVDIYLANDLIFSTKLFSIEEVKEITLKDYYKKVIEKMI